jgi:outer membrane murein-binding lipoprotein Lpp
VKTAVVTTLAALLAVLTLAGPVSAATPIQRQVKTLQRQVKALQSQVKILQQQLTLRKRSNLSVFAGGAYIYGACLTAATADAFQGTWEAIDRHAGYNAHAPDTWPAQAPIADPLNSCQSFNIQRTPNPAAVPTTDVFAALLNFFR